MSGAPLKFGLTPRQHKVLEFLRGFSERHGGIMPTFQQICDAVKIRSKSNIAQILDGLEDRGHIKRLRNRHRAIKLLE